MARLVVRGVAGGPPDPPEAVLERGWCRGLGEVAEVLGSLAGSVVRWGRGLGGGAPFVSDGETLTGCGVPVVATSRETEGPGGAYRLEGGRVLREAGGREEVLLEPEEEGSGMGAGFELLWFGPTERFLLRGGLLEIDDLFSRAVVPVGTADLDRLLVRTRRLDPACLEGLEPPPTQATQRVEVRRDLALVAGAWADAVAVLERREGVTEVEVHRGEVVLEVAGEVRLRGALRESGEGWEVLFPGGEAPWRRIWMEREGERLVHGAEPTGSLLDPALRTRHAFDLFSDLVRLGTEG